MRSHIKAKTKQMLLVRLSLISLPGREASSVNASEVADPKRFH